MHVFGRENEARTLATVVLLGPQQRRAELPIATHTVYQCLFSLRKHEMGGYLDLGAGAHHACWSQLSHREGTLTARAIVVTSGRTTSLPFRWTVLQRALHHLYRRRFCRLGKLVRRRTNVQSVSNFLEFSRTSYVVYINVVYLLLNFLAPFFSRVPFPIVDHKFLSLSIFLLPPHQMIVLRSDFHSCSCHPHPPNRFPTFFPPPSGTLQ